VVKINQNVEICSYWLTIYRKRKIGYITDKRESAEISLISCTRIREGYNVVDIVYPVEEGIYSLSINEA